MSLARKLTMGTEDGRPRRHRGGGRFPLPDEFKALRTLTARVVAGNATADDLEQLAQLVDTARSLTRRLRFEEGAIVNAACAAYRDATGDRIGPETGILA